MRKGILLTLCMAVLAVVLSGTVTLDGVDDISEILSVSTEGRDFAETAATESATAATEATTAAAEATVAADAATTAALESATAALEAAVAADEAYEAAHHFHSYERWCGLSSSPSGEVNRWDAATTLAFTIDAGNKTWGPWVQIAGSSDTPIDGGNVKYDLHRLFITAFESASATHRIQIGFGASGAAALSAGTYSEVLVKAISNQIQETPLDIQAPQQAAGTKAWARVWAFGTNTATVKFFVGVHEYAQ